MNDRIEIPPKSGRTEDARGKLHNPCLALSEARWGITSPIPQVNSKTANVHKWPKIHAKSNGDASTRLHDV
jgi:hypothetical protein